MDIFTNLDLKTIEQKKIEIESKNLKTLEKNLLLMNLFDKHFSILFKTFENNIDKHIMFIKAKTNIEFSKVKYLHYIKTNYKNLYDKYILLGNTINKDNSSINSIKHYSDNKSSEEMESDKEETNNLLKLLEMKKDYIKIQKELKLNKNLNLINSIVIFTLLSLILYLI